MGEVVDIKRRKREFGNNAEPQPDVIAMLERLLEMACAGEITGIAGVYLYRDSSTGNILSGGVTYAVLGRLEEVKADIVEQLR